MPKQSLTSEDLMELARGFQPARVLLSAHELGVFVALANGPRTSTYVAKSIRADARACA